MTNSKIKTSQGMITRLARLLILIGAVDCLATIFSISGGRSKSIALGICQTAIFAGIGIALLRTKARSTIDTLLNVLMLAIIIDAAAVIGVLGKKYLAVAVVSHLVLLVLVSGAKKQPQN